VSLYGLVDTGVEYVSNVGASSDSLVRVPTLTGTFPSRWGVRGEEDLGGGLKAIVTLESGFDPGAGTSGQGGRLFGRQAFVGLSGGWGALTIGRNYTMLFWSLISSDIIGPNIHGLGSLDPYIAGARADNSIAYRGTFSGLTLGATYSLGRDVAAPGTCAGESAADKKACREYSGLLKYDTPTWGVAAAFDRLYGGAGGGAGLTSSSLTDDRSTVNGWVRFGPAKIGLGWYYRNNDGSPTPKSTLWYLQGAYDVAPNVTIDGYYATQDYKDSDNGADMFVLRGTYRLSKRTAAYVTTGRLSNDGTLALSVSGGTPAGAAPGAGESQNGVMLGLRHSF
jgi:predicted porin